MTLHLKVKPGSKIDRLFYDAAGHLTVKIKPPAQDGKANAYLVEYLAKQFGISKLDVTIVSGFTNPHKRIDLNVVPDDFDTLLKQLEREKN